MTSDHCSDIIDQNILYSHLLSDTSGNILCIFQAISVRDHYDLILPAFRLFYCHINNFIQRLLATTFFRNHLKFSIVIHMYDRFHLHKCPQNCCRFGNTSTSLQMIQIIHRNIMANVKLVLFCPLCDLINRLAFFFQLKSIVQKQALSQAGAKCIDHDNLCFRIILRQFFRRDSHTIACSA